jgi:hypothetical protein
MSGSGLFRIEMKNSGFIYVLKVYKTMPKTYTYKLPLEPGYAIAISLLHQTNTNNKP